MKKVGLSEFGLHVSVKLNGDPCWHLVLNHLVLNVVDFVDFPGGAIVKSGNGVTPVYINVVNSKGKCVIFMPN